MEELTAATDLVFERGTLVDLHIGKPTFQKKLKPNDVLIDGINEEALYLGHKKLLPKKALETLTTLEGRARNALAERSLAFPISGARFVQRSALPMLLGNLQSMKRVWDAEVAELVAAYPALKEEQLRRLEDQNETFVDRELAKYSGDLRAVKGRELANWLELQRSINNELYPHQSQVGPMFKFVWRMFKVTAAGMDEMDDVAQSEFKAAAEQLQRDVQLWVREATRDMHKALGDAALNAKNMLEKNGKLDPRNLRPLFAAFETFKAVDFTGSSPFRRTIDEIRQRFGVTAEDEDTELNLNMTAFEVGKNSDSRGAFSELLSSIAHLAEDEVARKAGLHAITSAGDFRRVIDI